MDLTLGESDKYNELKQIGSEYKSIFVGEDGWLDVPKIMAYRIGTKGFEGLFLQEVKKS